MPAILEFLAETPAALAAIPVTDRLSFVMGWYAFYFLFWVGCLPSRVSYVFLGELR